MYCQHFRFLRASKSVLLKHHRSLVHQTNAETTLKPRATTSGTCRTNHALIEPVRNLLQNGSVLISRSNSILDNLCLEEWIYRNYDFSHQNELILLLWHNNPAVVVGRHQNLWSEVAVDFARSEDIQIVRRNSGGGTVYHDLLNLNLSFLTSKSRYDRKRNLAFVGRVLRDLFHIQTEISPREDLVIRDTGEKVSGTASKLNAYNSYHHCTLLVDVDRRKLSQSLRKLPIDGLKSNATKSVPSPVLNLKTLNPSLTIESLIDQLSRAFPEMAKCSASDHHQAGIHYIDRPMDHSQFGNISHIYAQFEAWSWVYGKSPKFTLTTQFHFQTLPIQLELQVEKGTVVSIRFAGPPHLPAQVQSLVPSLEHCLIGTQFEQSHLVDSIHKFKTTNQAASSSSPSSSSILPETISVAIFNVYKKCLHT